jgi:hypothetical protein
VSVPYFLLFLCFRKVTQKIFSELNETKAKVPIFSDTRRSPKQRRRRARGRPHHAMARDTPRLRRAMVWAPGPSPFRLYILLDEKILRPKLFSRKHTTSRRCHRRKIGRVQKLFSALCRRGESPPDTTRELLIAASLLVTGKTKPATNNSHQ